MPRMIPATARTVVALALVGMITGACGSTVTPAPSQTPEPSLAKGPPPTPPLTPPLTPPPTPEPSIFPLAVVARFTDLRVGIETDELAAAVAAGEVLVPCGLSALEGIELGDESLALPDQASCLPPEKIVERVRARGGPLGLLPVGTVTAAVKVLRLGNADLFGSPSRRAEPYPLVGVGGSFDPGVSDYDPEEVRTLISLGDTCPDRGVAQQTITLGKGWDWVLDGGTARYTGTYMDTRFTGRDGRGWPVVKAVRLGDRGRVRAIMQDAEMTVDDFRCPMVSDFVPAVGGSTVFSIDPKVAPLLAGAGIDLVSIASNHMYDQGAKGIRQTIDFLEAAGIKHVGAGMDLAEALEPAVIDVRGLRFAFAGWDSTIGSPRAEADSPGTAALSTANLRTSIGKAAKVADVVIGMPTWNWPEYWAEFTSTTLKQRDRMYEIGVDHILGSGTHWAGAISLTTGEDGLRLAVTSHGNFLFGQDWSRQTQEGVIYELTFYRTRLAQVRIHPYIMLDQAQPNLVDPETDGAFVQKQVFDSSIFELP